MGAGMTETPNPLLVIIYKKSRKNVRKIRFSVPLMDPEDSDEDPDGDNISPRPGI